MADFKIATFADFHYAMNWRSNTFAQPGRISGHQWTAINCSNVGAAASWDGRVARAHFCSFLLTASIEERIPLLQYTGTLSFEGAPRVGFTRGSLYPAVTIDLFSG